MEKYFQPAVEFAQLINAFNTASETEKEAIGRRIYDSEYLVRLRTVQSYSGVEFLKGDLPRQQVNTIKKDFFYNPCVPVVESKTAKPICETPYHCHDYFEMVVVYKGSYTQSINGILHTHQAGDICLLNPNVYHRDARLCAEDRVMFFGLSSKFLKEKVLQSMRHHSPLLELLKQTQNQQYILFHTQDFAGICKILCQILQEDYHKQPGHHTIIEGLLVRLFSALEKEREYSVCQQSKEEIHANLIAEILQYMQENLDTVTRQEIANLFHFNADYLNRLLQSVTGKSYSNHLREIRLAQASYLLIHTNESVNDIIRRVGVCNKGYFNEIFQEKHGMLPGAYRKENQ